ncbi:hypothetical protein [Pseudopedobacter beijingensis]|uniref:Uncharacterized protein n=1 Tax=Pseudopedobacter beijingensis TaxID=1207056 RepID=A0ABW4IF92_9SPHI
MQKITIEIKSKSKREMLLKILDAVGIPYSDVENPSSSGDKWFLDSENIKTLKKGIEDAKEGSVIRIKDINNIWGSIL